jgi:hypothetical protein
MRKHLDQALVGFPHPMETPMTKLGILSAGLIAAATLITPAMAQEATQEPGIFAFNYPNTHYMTGGYGVRATPGPGYYYWNEAHGYAPDYYPRVGYAYRQAYGWNNARPYPSVGAFATAPWTDSAGYGSYAYYGGPEPVWVAP